MNIEIWKDVPNYEGIYKVSNLGNVKSLNYRKQGQEKNLKGFIQKGYHRVKLTKKGLKKMFSVHQLVAIAFLNHKPKETGLVVNHINFVRDDNRLENLEIVTIRENSNLKHIPSRSKYVGVHFRKDRNTWVARIVYGKNRKYLGSYKTELEAHFAYQKELLSLS